MDLRGESSQWVEGRSGAQWGKVLVSAQAFTRWSPDGKLDWMWYSWVNCTWARPAAVCVAAASASHINYRVTEPKPHAAASWADNPPSRLALRSPWSRCGVNKRARPIAVCRLNCEGSTAPEETLIWTEPPPHLQAVNTHSLGPLFVLQVNRSGEIKTICLISVN